MLNCTHMLFPLNWDLKLLELLWASLSNMEEGAWKLLLNHVGAAAGEREACSSSPASALDG